MNIAETRIRNRVSAGFNISVFSVSLPPKSYHYEKTSPPDAVSPEFVFVSGVDCVTCVDDEEGQPPREYYAMNEVAAARGAKGNIVDFDFSIAGDHIAHMRGDGLIVATATGSTAYALSAGGPLVGPTFTGMIVAPLAPHTLNARPIVAERNDIIEIDMPDDMQVGDVGLFIDGDTIELDSPIKNVTIMVGPDPTVILSCRKDSFYKQISRTFFDKK